MRQTLETSEPVALLSKIRQLRCQYRHLLVLYNGAAFCKYAEVATQVDSLPSRFPAAPLHCIADCLVRTLSY